MKLICLPLILFSYSHCGGYWSGFGSVHRWIAAVSCHLFLEKVYKLENRNHVGGCPALKFPSGTFKRRKLLFIQHFCNFYRQQAKKEEDFLRSQIPDGSQEQKDFDERTLHWANYAHGPYGPNHPHSEAIPYDPRDPDKDTYAHGRMHPNDYAPRHHIYESPNFTWTENWKVLLQQNVSACVWLLWTMDVGRTVSWMYPGLGWNLRVIHLPCLTFSRGLGRELPWWPDAMDWNASELTG